MIEFDVSETVEVDVFHFIRESRTMINEQPRGYIIKKDAKDTNDDYTSKFYFLMNYSKTNL